VQSHVQEPTNTEYIGGAIHSLLQSYRIFKFLILYGTRVKVDMSIKYKVKLNVEVLLPTPRVKVKDLGLLGLSSAGYG